MRILIAAIFGGIVMFCWGAVAHMALGLGNVGIHQPAHEDTVLSSLHEGLGAEAGVYLLPSFDPHQRSDPAAMAAYAKEAAISPYAMVVYLPQGDDMTQMGPRLARQWASDTLSALALAVLMGWLGAGFARRMAVAAVVPIFAWLSILVPYWNWYRFPCSFTGAALLEQWIGWLLAGTVMAWWLGRGVRKPA
jgi:hypothetical protein